MAEGGYAKLSDEPDRRGGRISETVCWTVRHSTEDPEKVRLALQQLTGDSTSIEAKATETHFHHEMEILTASMKGEKEFRRIASLLRPATLEGILETLEERLDDGNVLHFRLDKQSCLSGRPVLSSDLDPTSRKEHDSIDVEVHVVTYPGKRSNAVKFIRQLLLEIKAPKKQG